MALGVAVTRKCYIGLLEAISAMLGIVVSDRSNA